VSFFNATVGEGEEEEDVRAPNAGEAARAVMVGFASCAMGE